MENPTKNHDYARVALESMDEQVLVIDDNYEIVYANTAAAGAYGMTSEAMEGRVCYEVTHDMETPCHGEGIQCPHQHVFGTGKRTTVDHKHVEDDGVHYYELSASPVTQNDTVTRMVEVMTDITPRKQREAKLRKLRRAVEEAGLAVFITDIDGTIEYVNPAFESITGFTREEAVGRTPQILQSGEVSQAYYGRMWGTILDGDLWQEEIPNRRKSGERYTANQTIAPITDGDRDVTGFVAIQEDITERKEREQHLQVLNRVLRHNHRNLLNSVLGAANSLDPSAVHEDAHYVPMMQEATAELHELSEKAYTLTTLLMEDAQQSLISDLGATIKTVLEEFELRYPQADVSTSIVEGISISAHHNFELAIRELVENAIEHNDTEAPAVGISLHRSDQRVTIDIADNGPGIPTHEYSIITGDDEITQVDHGSGLGLWLAYWVVKRSGGDIQFTSDAEGTSVSIELRHDPDMDHM